MRRGTTPPITIKTDIDLSDYAAVWFTLVDETGTELTIETDDLTITSTGVSVTLTQAQTISLASGKIQMQLRALDTDGTAIASNIMQTTLETILKEGEISAD